MSDLIKSTNPYSVSNRDQDIGMVRLKQLVQEYKSRLTPEDVRRINSMIRGGELLNEQQFEEILKFIIYTLDKVMGEYISRLYPHNLQEGVCDNREFLDKGARQISLAISNLTRYL